MSCVTWHLLMLGQGLTGVSVCVCLCTCEREMKFLCMFTCGFFGSSLCVPFPSATLPHRHDNAAGKSQNSKV